MGGDPVISARLRENRHVTPDRFSVITDGLPSQLPDVDPDETREWLESLDTVINVAGRRRARYLMLKLLERARERQVGVPALRSTDYINTIPPEREPWFPGDEYAERRIRAYIRWNAAIMVSRANRPELGVGGHIATYASMASLYEVGFNHFFRGKDHGESGDQVFFQGHGSPGIYGRAYLEGRLTEGQLDGFRQELSHQVDGRPEHGSRPDPRDLPGPVQPVPAEPADQGHQPVPGVGVPRRRRDGRAGVARRDRGGRPRGAGQPDLRGELQPAAAGRSGPRQWQDHPGAGGILPRRRLERDQGGLGPAVGRAAGPGRRRRAGEQDELHAGRAVPDVRHRRRRVHPGGLLRLRPQAAQDGRAPDRRPAAAPAPRRARLPQDLRGVQGG